MPSQLKVTSMGATIMHSKLSAARSSDDDDHHHHDDDDCHQQMKCQCAFAIPVTPISLSTSAGFNNGESIDKEYGMEAAGPNCFMKNLSRLGDIAGKHQPIGHSMPRSRARPILPRAGVARHDHESRPSSLRDVQRPASTQSSRTKRTRREAATILRAARPATQPAAVGRYNSRPKEAP